MNFYKSKMPWINVVPDFMNMFDGFLLCKKEIFPFKYLILHMGVNPRK